MINNPIIENIIKDTELYNLHSHTQFCDGHATMEHMAQAAADVRMRVYGFSPHSPLPIASPCNMAREAVPAYINEARRLAALHAPSLTLHTAMEVDYLSPDWGPHIDYFQRLPLSYIYNRLCTFRAYS